MVCLDTSFLIDMIRGKEEVIKLEEEIEKKEEVITIAAPSIMELFRGLYITANLKNIDEEEIKKIDGILSSIIILNLDKESAMLAGKIEAGLINKGEVIDIEDIMIGAIVKQNHEKLLTRNKKHFERIKGLDIESY